MGNSAKCQNCGNEVPSQAKFCPKCGTSIKGTLSSKEITPGTTLKSKQIEEESRSPTTQSSRSLVPIVSFWHFINTHIFQIFVVIGTLSLIAAVTFVIIAFIPRELITDIEIPPIEGFIFDFFVIISIILTLGKEISYILGYMRRKTILDKWFSFVILLIWWINLITYALNLVRTSIFYDLGVTLPQIFLLFSMIDLVVALFYFVRYRETLFSSTLVVSIMTIIYLQQWIIPVEPIIYTAIILMTSIILFLISLLTKNVVPTIGTMVLVPVMFLSPYILSNTWVIAIAVLFGSFPFVEIYLNRKVRTETPTLNKSINVISNVSSLFGIITLGFAVFYGHLGEEMFLLILSIIVMALIILKMLYKEHLVSPLKDWFLSVIIIFFIAFFDMISINIFILTGLAGIQTLFASFNFWEYVNTKNNQLIRYSEFLLLATLTIISITKIDFIPKSSFIILPLLSLLLLLHRRIEIDHTTVRLFVFGFSSLFILNFFQHTLYDWIIIPVYSLIALEGIVCIKIFHDIREQESFHLDLSILTLILEIDLLILMLGTTTRTEMIYPVIMLIAVVILVSGVQLKRHIHEKFLWINSTYIIAFGIMVFWNEFDPIFTLIITMLTLLPLMLEKVSFSMLDLPVQLDRAIQSHNFNIALSALGLTLVILFEELDPVIHAILLLLGPLLWIIISYQNNINNSITTLLTLIPSSFIFLVEMIIHNTLFTPITETFYLYSTLIVVSIPAIILQSAKILKKKELTVNHINPLIIMTAALGILITYSTWIYKLDIEVISLLYIILLVLFICSSIVITWQYESILLVIITFIPSILFRQDLGFHQLVLYILPILPLCFNIGIALKRMKSPFAVKIHEILMVIYLIFFIIFYPIKFLEYTALLATLLLISWQLLGILNKKLDPHMLEWTNFLNSILVLVLIIFIESFIPETTVLVGNVVLNLNGIFLGIITAILGISILLIMIYSQIKREIIARPILVSGTLVSSFSALILTGVSLLIRTTDISFEILELGILVLASSLLMGNLVISILITRINTQIFAGITLATSAWVVIVSEYFPNIELIFLWITFAPVLLGFYFKTRDRNYIISGVVFYMITSIRLLAAILNSLQTGVTNWLAIIGLIFLGVELISIGMYKVQEKREPKSTE